jgi:DNA repair protein RadC
MAEAYFRGVEMILQCREKRGVLQEGRENFMGVIIEMKAPVRAVGEGAGNAVWKAEGEGREGQAQKRQGRVGRAKGRVAKGGARTAGKKAIKHWAPEERPRERLVRLGAEYLSEAEILAILLRDGGGKRSAVDLAREVLDLYGPLHKLSDCTHGQLMNIPGIGAAKATAILATFEVCRRKLAGPPPDRACIRNSRDSADYARRWLGNLSHEAFAVMYLAQAGWVKDFEVKSEGGITSTTVDARLILRRALELCAVSLIVFHNHPSGSLRPSKSDEQLTQRLSEAAKTMDIKLLDHVIIGESGYFSFADEGLLV